MRIYPSIGIQAADILLPGQTIDHQKWAVIACDQFTSQPQYWQEVQQSVGDAPSTYHLILPEVDLGTPAEAARIQSTQQAMRDYLANGFLEKHEGFIYVERTVAGKTRHGLMLALDLEKYDYNKGSQTLIRATEGTILDRLPPRIRIREGAPLELPHILVLIDDPAHTVIKPIGQKIGQTKPIYDFDLMQGSGHLRGYFIQNLEMETQVVHALEALADPRIFHQRYEVGTDKGVLLFAVGDGNHSLATAKAIWEKVKPQVGMNHPARYALVELENVHDEGLEFEPIHRVVFDVKDDYIKALRTYFGDNIRLSAADNPEDMINKVKAQAIEKQAFGIITPSGCQIVWISNAVSNLPVGTLQAFLDQWLKQGGAGKIDYVHGDDVVCELGSHPGHLGFYLPSMPKGDLFKTVILDGALPRKTFSMGEAIEKRFYMECRKIA